MPARHIGRPGCRYRHWRGVFCPAKLPVRRWFEHYSQQFRTLELNVTFSRFPQLSFLENWYAQAPAGFQFAVKVPQLITHYKQFHGVGHLYASPCDAPFLQRIAAEVAAAPGVEQAYLYFNNDIGASAIGNTHQLLALVGATPQ